MKKEKKNNISKAQKQEELSKLIEAVNASEEAKESVKNSADLEKKANIAKNSARNLKQKVILASVNEVDYLQQLAKTDKKYDDQIKGHIEILWLIQDYASKKGYVDEELITHARFILGPDLEVSPSNLRVFCKEMRDEILYRLRSEHANALTYREIAVLVIGLEPMYLKVFDYKVKNFGIKSLKTKKVKQVMRQYRDLIERETGDFPEKLLLEWAREMDAKEGN